jgi:hypothetical protein
MLHALTLVSASVLAPAITGCAGTWVEAVTQGMPLDPEAQMGDLAALPSRQAFGQRDEGVGLNGLDWVGSRQGFGKNDETAPNIWRRRLLHVSPQTLHHRHIYWKNHGRKHNLPL